MSPSRLELLEEAVRQRAQDAFAHYGLAMEYINAERPHDALATFNKLLAFNSNYTAAYYHKAVLLGKLGRAAEARQTFQQGMDVARRNGDFHTLSEMEAALHALPA